MLLKYVGHISRVSKVLLNPDSINQIARNRLGLNDKAHEIAKADALKEKLKLEKEKKEKEKKLKNKTGKS